ncbi:MAG TPA: ATP-binding protein [Gemmataceae bacterium]|nr:ATP-binding protein [Gemmataceae bacterium]
MPKAAPRAAQAASNQLEITEAGSPDSNPALHPFPDFRLLFESAPGLYLVLSADFNIVAVSEAYLCATMTKREHILGRGIFDAFPDNPNDPAATGASNLDASLKRVLRDRVPDSMAVQKYDIRRPEADGGEFEERYWSPVNSPIFGPDGEIAYIIHRVDDVTEFVRLRQQGADQEKLTQKLLTHSEQMEAEVVLRAQQIQEGNRRLREINEALQTEIAERLRSEQALRDQTRVLTSILGSMGDGVVVADEKGKFTHFNPAAERILGLGLTDSAPEKWAAHYGVYLPDNETLCPTNQLPLVRAFRGEAVNQVDHIIRNEKLPLGIWVSVTGRPLRDESGANKGGVVVFQDVTARKQAEDALQKAHVELERRVEERTAELCRANERRQQLEEQYRQAQKLESIGQLAGGVAHDFNNLLTIISGYSDLLLDNPHLDEQTKGLLEEISKAGVRAASLTRQLLAFGRKQVVEFKVLDLNTLVTDTEKMLRRLIDEDVSLTTVLAPALGQVKADLGQMEQVIMNLAVNARDAMPQGGKLTIETANVELDNSYAETHAEVRPGWYVLLAVSDTGCGMTEEVKARIFEPFFTTKGLGKGTGLGLATVYGIVKQSGGHIWMYSEPDRGTTFKVYLPLVGERISSGKSFPGLRATPTGNETILLVEDEDAVRAITRHVLQSWGYTVLEARRGGEAILLCQQHQGKIDLVVSDVVMPEIGGRELVERVTMLHPGIKVLYLSGYTDDAVVRHGILQAEVAFLQKPFRPAALANKVREVLDQ